MAGHSKWSQIKRKKGALDVKRGALFSKLSREIQVAVREGGSAPENNIRLRLAIERAKKELMPKDTIEGAIAKASGAGADGANWETITYEGYGPNGIAVMAVALTDNRNRTASEVRFAFSRQNGTLGETGCVAWQFDRVGQIVVPLAGNDPDDLALIAIDAGATDVEPTDDSVIVTTDPTALTQVMEQLKENELEIDQADIQMVPQATIDIEGGDATKALKLLEALDELEDVQAVYTNASFPAEMEAAVA